MIIRLFGHGPAEDPGEVCINDELEFDTQECADYLWAIEEDGVMNDRFVCTTHKDAYKASVGIA